MRSWHELLLLHDLSASTDQETERSYPDIYIRVSASQNDGKKQMALKCTEISFFHVLLSKYVGSSTSIFFFPGFDLTEKPKFGDQNCHL